MTSKPILLEDYKPPLFLVRTIDLTFVLNDTNTSVHAVMHIVRNGTHSEALVLNGEHLMLDEVILDDVLLAPSAYRIDDTTLTIDAVPDDCVLQIKNRINVIENKALDGLYKSEGIFCTQNEPEGFRRITYYIDRPDVMARFTTKIIALKNEAPILLSNGNMIDSGELEGGFHYAVWEDPFVKPSYLYALVAGNLGNVHDTFTTKSGRVIDLDIYCDIGNESKCAFAMTSLKNAMKWDEDTFDREYDLDRYMIVAVDAFNMGAMENKGLNIFNSHYVLADQESATDSDFLGIESVIGHEYFHNWTGNRITCRSWFELTLKEGLTVYRDQEFSATLNDVDVQRISDVAMLRLRQFAEDASPTAHPIKPKEYLQINNFYTATVYEKGAEVIRMLATLLGKEGFKKGMDKYFDTFDGQAVGTQEFLWSMQEANTYDLTQFARWYDQVGTPHVDITTHFDETKKTFTLHLKQVHKDQALVIPLKSALLMGEQTTHETLIVLDKKEQTFVFEDVLKEPYLSINRDFSAPITLSVAQKENALAYLMSHDSNAFNRYEAGQNYALHIMQNMLSLHQANSTLVIDNDFLEAFERVLDDTTISDAIKAKMIQIPSLDMLIQRFDEVDVHGLYEVRKYLCYTLAHTFEDKLYEIVAQNSQEHYELHAKAIGKRALKNSAMILLGALQNEKICTFAYAMYQNATNMTDRFVMLALLSNIECKERHLSQEDFYARYENNSLVINKYLAVIASSSLPHTLQRVRDLQTNKVYSTTIPNLVRALIGTFAKNPIHFHATDGSGYSFVADKIIAIDLFNPQIASGLATAFKIYPKLPKTLRAHAKKELSRILEVENISTNVYEIVNKIISSSKG